MATQSQSVPEAQLRLGDCYSAGRGVARDLDAANAWYAKAAASGNAAAAGRLQQLAESRLAEADAGAPSRGTG
jgi:TPR repeat protein